MMAYEHEKELADAYDQAVIDSAFEAHAAAYPEGCGCPTCDQRLADRCAAASGHIWPEAFDYGDTCYCGALYLLKDEHGRVSVVETPRD
jgi:hypothetical protein